MTRHANDALRAAIASGVLPADARIAQQDSRPWPVVLLTALGAWLAALPLLGVVGMLLGDLISRGVGPYLVGVLVLSGAVVVLRSSSVPIFFEQLATPALLVGAGALSFGLFRDLPDRAAALVLLLVAGGLAFAIPRAWLRVLLGAAAAILLGVVLAPERMFNGRRSTMEIFWFVLHGVLAVWLAALALQRRAFGSGAQARTAAALESLATGWALSLLVGLSWLAGMTFLVGGTFGGGLGAEIAREMGRRERLEWQALALQAGSVLLAMGAAGWTARAWPQLRQPLVASAAAVLLVLAWFLPSLGAVLLMLAIAGTTRRWRLASAAGVAVAWIIGGYYYQLQWPLAWKAVVLVATGAALGGLAWLAHRRPDAPGTADAAGAPAQDASRGAPAWIALAAVATLAICNFAIWQKENIIANGKPVFVELAPADPRSLMQGDFMRLNFSLPPALEKDLDDLVTRKRPHAIAKRDARGVATLLRLARTDTPLGDGEFRIELTPKNGGWILVSDAWFFREGDAALWEKAKFGEFRILPSGAALLVGMADAELKAIGR
ncbi:MAG TPA: GDYXXLXY domain-containing protein [Burkholderiaceae bacterium]|nr:GDYXXLXY domain-containing protein [Burkholderiaceae bacterium]